MNNSEHKFASRDYSLENGSSLNGLSMSKERSGRRGVVAVIRREERFLVIRRSMHVVAPGLICFPGGGIEAGETESQALIREMREELALEIEPVLRIWSSVTPSGTPLGWWSATIPPHIHPIPNPAEVAEAMWMDADQLRRSADRLPSLPQFLDALERGEIRFY